MTKRNKQQTRTFYVNLFAVLFAFGAYLLPWLINPGAALSPSALDLAEWASLHPEVRAMSPSLLTSLLLRLPPIGLIGILAFSTPAKPHLVSREWALSITGIVVVLLMVFPPWEALSARHDPNFQQQLQLIVVGVIGSAVGLSGKQASLRPFAVMLCALISMGVSLLGLQQGYGLMADFNLPVRVGFGGVGFSIIMIMVIITTWPTRNTKQG